MARVNYHSRSTALIEFGRLFAFFLQVRIEYSTLVNPVIQPFASWSLWRAYPQSPIGSFCHPHLLCWLKVKRQSESWCLCLWEMLCWHWWLMVYFGSFCWLTIASTLDREVALIQVMGDPAQSTFTSFFLGFLDHILLGATLWSLLTSRKSQSHVYGTPIAKSSLANWWKLSV